jgi:hypothetical protein
VRPCGRSSVIHGSSSVPWSSRHRTRPGAMPVSCAVFRPWGWRRPSASMPCPDTTSGSWRRRGPPPVSGPVSGPADRGRACACQRRTPSRRAARAARAAASPTRRVGGAVTVVGVGAGPGALAGDLGQRARHVGRARGHRVGQDGIARGHAAVVADREAVLHEVADLDRPAVEVDLLLDHRQAGLGAEVDRIEEVARRRVPRSRAHRLGGHARGRLAGGDDVAARHGCPTTPRRRTAPARRPPRADRCRRP